MGADLYQSRRTNFVKCRYWIAKDTEAFKDLGMEAIQSDDGYKISQYCDGVFMAKERTAEDNSKKIIENVYMYNVTNIQLETTDNISYLTQDSIVEYNGLYWRVTNIQKEKIKKQGQFLRKPSYKYYLSLTR